MCPWSREEKLKQSPISTDRSPRKRWAERVERKSTQTDYGGDFSTFGPLVLSVLLLPFATNGKSKRHRASSGKNNDVAQTHRLLDKNQIVTTSRPWVDATVTTKSICLLSQTRYAVFDSAIYCFAMRYIASQCDILLRNAIYCLTAMRYIAWRQMRYVASQRDMLD